MSSSPAAARRSSSRPSVGGTIQTRITADLAAAIEGALRPETDDQPGEAVADFVRTALWHEAQRRNQTRPTQPVSLADLATRLDRLAGEVQAVRNADRLQVQLLELIAAELTPTTG
jgi:hypothetical protein